MTNHFETIKINKINLLLSFIKYFNVYFINSRSEHVRIINNKNFRNMGRLGEYKGDYFIVAYESYIASEGRIRVYGYLCDSERTLFAYPWDVSIPLPERLVPVDFWEEEITWKEPKPIHDF